MLIFAKEDVDPFTLYFGSSNSNAFAMNQHPNNSSQQQPHQRQQQEQPAPPPPLFTMQQLQLLQLQARQQVQQQQPPPNQLNQQQFNLSGVNNCANNNSSSNDSHMTNQSNNNSSPYMVLTQLPLQVTPFGRNVIDGSNNNNSNQRNTSLTSTQQVMHEWAQILQPTPIGNEGVHGANHGGLRQPNTSNNNNSNNLASEAQSQSLMQQFLYQLGFGGDSSNAGNVNGNNNLAPVGSVPPQQTIPTRMEPVDPKRSSFGILSDWFMPNNNNSDGKRKFSLTNSVGHDPVSADDFDWSTPTAFEEIGVPAKVNVQQHHQPQEQQQQQQSMNAASLLQQQDNNSKMFSVSDQYGQNHNNLNLLQQQQMMSHRNQCNRTPDDDMSTSTTNSSNKRAHVGRPVQRQPPTTNLPTTVMPPTVMTSVLPQDGSSSTGSNKPPAVRRRQGAKSSRVESPQDVLERMLSLRGYAAPGNIKSLRIKAEDANYDITPSPLQLASFGTEVVRAVHHSEVEKLGELLSTGLSPNPCNQFRDSIVDLVCKRGNAPVFRCLLEHGCDLRICDGFGRTPLHHCCWAADFCPEIATMILQVDPQQILMEDKRGQTPLEYVRAEQASEWNEFLEDHANRFFPTGGTLPPIMSLRQTRDANGHIPDPPNALPPQLAGAISSGQLSPQGLAQMDPAVRARFQ